MEDPAPYHCSIPSQTHFHLNNPCRFDNVLPGKTHFWVSSWLLNYVFRAALCSFYRGVTYCTSVTASSNKMEGIVGYNPLCIGLITFQRNNRFLMMRLIVFKKLTIFFFFLNYSVIPLLVICPTKKCDLWQSLNRVRTNYKRVVFNELWTNHVKKTVLTFWHEWLVALSECHWSNKQSFY